MKKAPAQKSILEIKEEHDLQLALALSKIEAEREREKEHEKLKKSHGRFDRSNKPNKRPSNKSRTHSYPCGEMFCEKCSFLTMGLVTNIRDASVGIVEQLSEASKEDTKQKKQEKIKKSSGEPGRSTKRNISASPYTPSPNTNIIEASKERSRSAERDNIEPAEQTKEHIYRRLSVNSKDTFGCTPLHRAAGKGSYREVDFLVNNGAEVNARDPFGKTPLQWAAESGHGTVIQYLVKKGALINAEDDEKATALHWASKGGNTNIIEFLLSNQASIDHLDSKGQTALHWAAKFGHPQTITTLLQQGASAEIKDVNGNTPCSLAKRCRRFNVISLFSDDKTTKPLIPGKEEDKDEQETSSALLHPAVGNVEEFKTLISKGTYESYENRVYLAGPCNVGKTCLARILIGEEISKSWMSTNSLTIYFGQNGILLKERKMVPLKKESTNVLSKLLLGKPEIIHERLQQDSDQLNFAHSTISDSGIGEGEHQPEWSETTRQILLQRNPTSSITESTAKAGSKEKCPDDFSHITGTKHKKLPQPKIKRGISSYKIHQNVLAELRKGKYKMEIAPSDLVDFGGQKSYDMTHQLFIQQKGAFVLMLNGAKDLFEPLEEYPQGDVTTTSILIHWVNSILIYCGDSDEKMPMILFAATHSDKFDQKELKDKRKQITEALTKIFSTHTRRQHIVFERIFFINATKPDDPEIEELKDALVNIAFQQSTWGKRMPVAWVPLELQITEMKLRGESLITKAKLLKVNESNEDLALNKTQFEDFLKVQHSLGKILYFDHQGLDDSIVIQPTAMVNILRSFVTDDRFWPKDDNLNAILRKLTKTGTIRKDELFQLWSQTPYKEIMKNDKIKEFVVQVLVHLDILIEPKRYNSDNCRSDYFLVPCIIKDKMPPEYLTQITKPENTICLSYKLKDSSVPTALAFKLIGAALSVWPLEESDGRLCLYNQSAVMCVDDNNTLCLDVNGQNIHVYLVNLESKHIIPPDIAASIQECLTLALTKILHFCHRCFGKFATILDVSSLFEMQVGVICHNKTCLRPFSAAREEPQWECERGEHHGTKYPLYWVFDRIKKVCDPDCTGLEEDIMSKRPNDQYLVRLARRIGIHDFVEFLIHLGMTRQQWEAIEYQYGRNGELSIKLMALIEWRKWKESQLSAASFRDLFLALSPQNEPHHLCQILREETNLIDIAECRLSEIPSDDVLKRLPKQIGNYVIQLGIELGLSIHRVEETMYNYPKDMYSQLYDILRKWKESSKVTTIYRLMAALQIVDSGGLRFLRDEYKHNSETT